MCTSIKLRNKTNIVLAQNYDFYYGHCLIITNARGIYKTALPYSGQGTISPKSNYNLAEKNNAAKWKSKYGNITFNQFARELPICGINEAGLSIVSMWHNTAHEPTIDGDNQITELQWIQMQLDLYSSIGEVMENLNNTTFKVRMYPMHYHLSDKTGESAIIELVNGKLTAFSNAEICACSNAGISESREYLKNHLGVKPADIRIKEPIMDRAAKAILMSSDYNQNGSQEEIHLQAFRILDYVSLPKSQDLFQKVIQGKPPAQTFFQVLIDITEMKILFRTINDKDIRELGIFDFEYSPQSPIKVFEIENGPCGRISNLFSEYTREANEKIVKKSFAPIKNEFSEATLKNLIEYPESFKIEY